MQGSKCDIAQEEFTETHAPSPELEVDDDMLIETDNPYYTHRILESPLTGSQAAYACANAHTESFSDFNDLPTSHSAATELLARHTKVRYNSESINHFKQVQSQMPRFALHAF